MNQSLRNDSDRYKELQILLTNLGADQMDTNEFKLLWKELEDIKNRNGGMPPCEPAK